MADGAPAAPSLFYAGTLEEYGAPVNDDVDIALTVYDAESETASAEVGSEPLPLAKVHLAVAALPG